MTVATELAGRAASAAVAWAQTPREDRAAALRLVADRLDEAADTLVPIGMRESHLPEGRLRGELRRTTFQLRLFADELADGAYLDVRIDHADPEWPMGAPRPDLRRILLPIGPVLVFAASNFPFAFSVAGGDTASALAAGCPVLVKTHPGHPELSAAVGDLVAGALAEAGAPDCVFGYLDGLEAGVETLRAPEIKAAAFTGSVAGGRALFDIATARPEPIPFYGELGSVNPVFVTASAAAERADQIVAEFVGSFTMGAGQFCTKPGVLLVPEGSDLVDRLTVAELPGAAPLLYPRIEEGYQDTLGQIAGQAGVAVLREPADDPLGPTLLRVRAADLLADLTSGTHEVFRECFGPTALVATYADESELLAVAGAIDGQLTATIVGNVGDAVVIPLRDALARKAGRVLWNAWPTGVSVTYAQQHGGPYPATTAPTTTSVGTAAITRFLRPVAYQGFPADLLPAEVRDDTDLPRLVDGRRV